MNEPLSPAQQRVSAMLGPLAGAQVPGGCDECDAYQTVEAAAPGVWTIQVWHDDDCPRLARLTWGAGR
jgi:hypothetical protein